MARIRCEQSWSIGARRSLSILIVAAMALGMAGTAGAQSEDSGGEGAEPCATGGGDANIVAGRYTGSIDVTISSSGLVAGNEVTIASVLRTTPDQPFNLQVGYTGVTDKPHYWGEAEIELSMGIDVAGQPISAVGGSATTATLNVSDTESWYLIDLKGRVPATLFSVDVTGRGASASGSRSQESADAHLVLVIDEFTCDTISGSLLEESPTVQQLGEAYTAMGLTTTTSGTWSVSLNDEDKDEELEVRVKEALEKANSQAPSFGLAKELLALTAELQNLPEGSYGKCFADEVLQAASLVVVKLQQESVKVWAESLGWTPRSKVDRENEDGTFSPGGSDAGTFSNPGSKYLMRNARTYLRAAQALGMTLSEDCENLDIGELIGDITLHLFNDAVKSGAPMNEVFGEAGMAQLDSGVSSGSKSEVNAHVEDVIAAARADDG